MTPLFLYRWLQKHYQGDWLQFEPETIQGIEIDNKPIGEEKDFNKVMALQTAINALSNDEGFHFTDWHMFEKIVLALNDVVPNFLEVEQAEPHEIEGALAILKKIKNNTSFNSKVASYIAASYSTNNIVHCPFHEEVDELLPESEVKNKVKKMLAKIKLDEPALVDKVVKLDNGALAVQLKRLLYVVEYKKAVVRENAEEETQ